MVKSLKKILEPLIVFSLLSLGVIGGMELINNKITKFYTKNVPTYQIYSLALLTGLIPGIKSSLKKYEE